MKASWASSSGVFSMVTVSKSKGGSYFREGAEGRVVVALADLEIGPRGAEAAQVQREQRLGDAVFEGDEVRPGHMPASRSRTLPSAMRCRNARRSGGKRRASSGEPAGGWPPQRVLSLDGCRGVGSGLLMVWIPPRGWWCVPEIGDRSSEIGDR